MLFWFLWSTVFLIATAFFVQSLVLYLRSRRRRARPRRLARLRVLTPELVALESQFFIAPAIAVNEARALATRLAAPTGLFDGAINQAAFANALSELQLYCQDEVGLSRARRR